jgi:hypothetical protein
VGGWFTKPGVYTHDPVNECNGDVSPTTELQKHSELFQVANAPVYERLHSFETRSTHPSVCSVGLLGVESVAVVPAFDCTRFIVRV